MKEGIIGNDNRNLNTSCIWTDISEKQNKYQVNSVHCGKTITQTNNNLEQRASYIDTDNPQKP